MFALIFTVYIQLVQLSPQIDRLEISPQRIESFEACETTGKLLSGVLLAETDPGRQFAWRRYECVQLNPN